MAPTLTNALLAMLVSAGTDIDLQAAVTGSPPLHFSWSKTSSAMTGATNPVLHLLNVVPTNSGDYVVTVSNYIGGPLAVTLSLRVVIPPRIQFDAFSSAGAFSFQTVAGQRYVVEYTDVLGGTWLPLSDSFVADGSSFVLSNSLVAPTQFYRVRVE
jgi:hypothetical protein